MDKLIDYKNIDSMKSIINRAVIFSLLLIFLLTCPAWAATYYVKNGGNDSNAGTSASPWAKCPGMDGWSGKATLSSGDTVYFDKAGTWSSNSSTTVFFKTTTDNVTYNGSTWGAGTRAKIEATSGYTGGVVGGDRPLVYILNNTITFTGFEVDGNQTRSSGIMVGYKLANANVDTVTINNCLVHDIGSFSVTGDWPYGILVSAAAARTTSKVNITNTTIYNTAHGGIDIYPTWTSSGYPIVDTVLIRNCTIYDTGKCTDGYARHNIEVVNDSRNVTVEFCNLYNSPTQGFYYRVSPNYEGNVANPPSGGIFRYNIVHNCGEGITTNNQRGLSGMTLDVYGNIFYNNKSWNITIGDGQSDSYPSGVFKFYNNTFLNTTASLAYGDISIAQYNMIGTVPTVYFVNNIVSVGNSTPIYDRRGAIATRTNNLLYRSSGTTLAYVSGTSYTSANIATWVGNSSTKTTDPAFTGGTPPTYFTGTYGSNMVPNTTYFALGSASPAVNAGTTLGSPYNGFINGAGLATPITRPQGASSDIGAYEYVESGSVITPPAVTPPAVTPPGAPKNLRVIE
ncbi:MAG TPA: right-handed parallel beta-helix repeat-containing protein [Candidatus Gastranaerophilales bacterium]|nr:right-handed parallel beta-helix repeat-containing protein [Candidatus Gastranaerophilales bacterium]